MDIPRVAPSRAGKARRTASATFLWLIVGAMAPGAAAAQQDPLQELQDVLEVYGNARETALAALAERNALRDAHEELISQRADAVRRRDDQRANQLTAEIQAKAEELDRADTELRRLDEAWVEAGEVLISRIDANREMVTDELERQPLDPQNEDRYRQLEERFDSLTVLRDSVDAEIPRVPLEVPTMPNVRALPGDGDAELHRKANIYRDIADVCARRIEKVEQRIGELERVRGLEAAKAEFDQSRAILAGRIPLGQAGGGTGRAVGDTTTDLRTTAQKIEELEGLREELEQTMAEAERREQQLRPGAGGGSG
ncbi:MAG: hypothetical protein F4059_09925 [Gemmatimonadetes bacterium]|nr:hypothetical protein [Gemmatimonadota bacterium]